MAPLNDIHIGRLIRQRLDETGISYKEFARLINCERQSLYYLFSCKSIDIDRLILISKVLGYDFIRNIYADCDSSAKTSLIINIPKDNLTGIDNIILNIIDDRHGVESSDTSV